MADRITAEDLVRAVGSRKARAAIGLEPVGDVTPAITVKAWCGRIVTFSIPGSPIGAPRMTQRDKWKQRPCVMAYRAWKDLARLCAGPMPDAKNVLSLSWSAFFVPPKSWSKKDRLDAMDNCRLHQVKPDRDNIDKAILDALFADDAAIASGHIEKRWSDRARLDVKIEIRET